MSHLPSDHLSFSSLNAFGGYFGCEYAWYLDRIEKAPRRPFGAPIALGRAFDKATQTGLDAKIASDQDPDPDMLGEAFTDEWATLRDDAEYDLEMTDNRFVTQGANASIDYATTVIPHSHPKQTQRRVEVAFDEVDWTLVGYIDLVESAETGVLVVDHKMTSSSSTKYDAAKASNDLQLGLYDVALTAAGENVAGRGFRWARTLVTKHEIGESVVASTNDSRAASLDLLGLLSGRIEAACESGIFLPTASLAGSYKCSERYCAHFESRCPFGARARTSVSLTGAAA